MRDPNAVKSTPASAIRLLTAEGLMDFNGHMSARLAGTDHVLIDVTRKSMLIAEEDAQRCRE
jgi:hypothetical protein